MSFTSDSLKKKKNEEKKKLFYYYLELSYYHCYLSTNLQKGQANNWGKQHLEMLWLYSLEVICQNPQWNTKIGSLLQNTDDIVNPLKDKLLLDSPESVG